MKKKSLKSLKLNRKSISSLQNNTGGLNWSDTNQPDQTLSVGCDFPTINDSCFSWCDDKCNDY
ncbi:hypothetical protein H2O64_04675 [Kordia sp. YSTF-M3]|uniref:Natural product n=1 Tax=Kordia aestuariivivens TaxID=2759037 RepID=A0ABR7Q681_9FLAO|nr:hypothetical protein [Kordia aestuariivivens]MBC8753953.1 hypothetical protein [Kordia aestuariivivens]